MAPLAAVNAQGTMPHRPQMFGERGVASCDVGQLFKPPRGSSDQAPAMQTKLSTGVICDKIRSDGMSRPSHVDHSVHGHEPMRVESYRAA